MNAIIVNNIPPRAADMEHRGSANRGQHETVRPQEG